MRVVIFGAGPGKGGKRVSGVIKDLPRNTSLRLGIISRRDPNAPPPGGPNSLQHYVKLRAGADVADINAAIPTWANRVKIPACGVWRSAYLDSRNST